MNSKLEIVWMKQCMRDFAEYSEDEFIKVDRKLREILDKLYQNTSGLGGTDMRRLRIGKKRVFLRVVENKVYCVGYKQRDHAYNKKQLKEMDKMLDRFLSEKGI